MLEWRENLPPERKEELKNRHREYVKKRKDKLKEALLDIGNDSELTKKHSEYVREHGKRLRTLYEEYATPNKPQRTLRELIEDL